ERLTDQVRADVGAGLVARDAAVRLPRERRLRDRPDDERVDEAGEDERHGGGAQGEDECLLHGHTIPTAARPTSMTLIPTNGATIPPKPYTSIERRKIAAAPSGRYVTRPSAATRDASRSAARSRGTRP